MADYPSFSDLFEVAVDAMTSLPGSKITEEAARREGSDVNVMLASAAAMADAVVQVSAAKDAGLLLDTAEGEALDRLAFDMPFPVSRNPAAAALVPIAFVRPTATRGGGTIPAGFRVSMAGVQFAAIYAVPVGSGALTASVDCRAIKSGPEGNIPVGTSGTLLDTLWDTTFVPTTSVVAAGGSDAETDDSLRARVRAEHETARRGILAAIVTGALTVPQCVHAEAYELTTLGQLHYAAELIVSDAAGNANAPLLGLVSAALEEYRGAGVPVTILGGVPLLLTMVWRFSFRGGVDTAQAASDALDRVVTHVNALGPGVEFDAGAAIEAALRGGTLVTGITGAALVTPPGNVIPTHSQVIRTTRALQTVVP